MDGTRPLEGKRALVTGAAIGIGRGIAAELARQGAQVALHYAYDTEPGPQAAAEIVAAGGRATAILADLSEVAACRRVVDEAVAFLGGLDILINNAGVTERGDFLAITPELYDRVFHINMRAQYFCAQAAVRHMLPLWGQHREHYLDPCLCRCAGLFHLCRDQGSHCVLYPRAGHGVGARLGCGSTPSGPATWKWSAI